MGWGKGNAGSKLQPLPDRMKVAPPGNEAEAAAWGAYLLKREASNRAKTHNNVDLCRGMFAVVLQSDEKARQMISLGSRVIASVGDKEMAEIESESPQLKDAVDAALVWANSQMVR